MRDITLLECKDALKRAWKEIEGTSLYLETKDLLNGDVSFPQQEPAEDLESVWEEEFQEKIPERFLEKRSALGSAPPGEMLYVSFVEVGEAGSRWLLTAEMLDVFEMGGKVGVWSGENLAVTPPFTLRPQEGRVMAELSTIIPTVLGLPEGVYGVLYGLKRYGRVLRLHQVAQGHPPLFKGLAEVFSLEWEKRILPHLSGYLGSFSSDGAAASLNMEGLLAMQLLPEYLKEGERLENLEEEAVWEGMGSGPLKMRVAYVMEALRRSLPLPKIFHLSRFDPLYVQKLWKIVKLMKKIKEEASGGFVFTTAQVGLLKKATRFSIPLTVLHEWTGMEVEELSQEMRRFSIGYRLNLPHEVNPLLPSIFRTALLRGEGRHAALRLDPEGRLLPVPMKALEEYRWEGERLLREDGLEIVEAGGEGAIFFTPSFGLKEYFPALRESY
ncbi:hypothetical protein B6U83_03985 [Thermoplasmatales archaeon ex4484_36]|nr:MAG: hypothetical protein B6U83_03985 [Thermoplasmatales archaeon ex4484_36]